jgi:hypothetical protein
LTVRKKFFPFACPRERRVWQKGENTPAHRQWSERQGILLKKKDGKPVNGKR